MKKIINNQEKYPFKIEASPHLDYRAFPTHSHGLHDIGWPEFFIDPLAFGPYGNADRINRSYFYFKRPENKKKLAEILKGKKIEIPIKTLNPKWKDAPNYTICYRLAPHNFEGVKMAYGEAGIDFDPSMKFVQIYVKGDNFALTDMYYRDGIMF